MVVLALNRTTRFLGGGLPSRLRAGDVGLEDGNCALPARTCLLTSLFCVCLSSAFEDVDDASTLRRVILEVARIGEEGRSAGTDEASEAWPSLSRAFVRALSFIGTGISSSELSLSVEYCCDCAFDSLLAAAAADSGTGLESLRLSCCLEGGRRRACRADVLLPRAVKWLPAPIGVGDAVAISVTGLLLLVSSPKPRDSCCVLISTLCNSVYPNVLQAMVN